MLKTDMCCFCKHKSVQIVCGRVIGNGKNNKSLCDEIPERFRVFEKEPWYRSGL